MKEGEFGCIGTGGVQLKDGLFQPFDDNDDVKPVLFEFVLDDSLNIFT